MYDYHGNGTIREALDAIYRHELVLPAIQREFIWDGEQVANLFDSLMRGYPFGTFLYWMVRPENIGSQRWYDFILHWHEKDAPHNSLITPPLHASLTAVLDGQQRLTALNVGLRGSMAWKLPGKWWKFPENFPTRRLYLNLFTDSEEEGDVSYQFRFLRDDVRRPVHENECWFRVSDIMPLQDTASVRNWLAEAALSDSSQAFHTLDALRKVVHENQLILAYQERSQETETVLRIFIRLNREGTPLSYSDLLLSVIIAQFGDMRNDILKFVDELNAIGTGFAFTKDFVLKAGLMLLDMNVGFKVVNFNRTNTERLAKDWDSIKTALKLTIRLISQRFRFGRENLRTSNVLLPIAYYLHRLAPGNSFLTAAKYTDDREAIREWLVANLLKRGFWASGIDSLLTALRGVIKDNSASGFPLRPIRERMAAREKPLSFDEEEVESLADLSYGDHRVFLLLSLLRDVNLADQHHIDHIFPRAQFTYANVPENKYEKYRDMMDKLANLQLLTEEENLESGTKCLPNGLRLNRLVVLALAASILKVDYSAMSPNGWTDSRSGIRLAANA